MQAVDAAEGPEVENNDFAAKILQGEVLSPVLSQARPSSSLARTRTLRMVFSLMVLSPVGCAMWARWFLLSPLCQRGVGGSLGVEVCDLGGLNDSSY